MSSFTSSALVLALLNLAVSVIVFAMMTTVSGARDAPAKMWRQ